MSGITGRKACVGGLRKSQVKALLPREELPVILRG